MTLSIPAIWSPRQGRVQAPAQQALPQGQFTCPEDVKSLGPTAGQDRLGIHIAENGYKFLDLADIS